MKAFFEQLKPDLELAEKYDSYLAIENHSGDTLLNSRDSFKAFLDMNPSSRIGIALAPYHLQVAGISVPEIIAMVGKHLFFFYAWQHGPALNQLPGIGPTDCRPGWRPWRRLITPATSIHSCTAIRSRTKWPPRWRPRATTCRSVTTKSSCSRVGWVECKGTKLP